MNQTTYSPFCISIRRDIPIPTKKKVATQYKKTQRRSTVRDTSPTQTCARPTNSNSSRPNPIAEKPLSHCQRSEIMAKQEMDLPKMPRKLTCDLCKKRRPVRDFGYTTITTKEAFSRRIASLEVPFLSSILNRLYRPRSLNLYGLEHWNDQQPFHKWSWRRYCYRHDDLWFSKLPERRRGSSRKTTPPLGNVSDCLSYDDEQRYGRVRMQYCTHCGKLVESDDRSSTGCKYCGCNYCKQSSRLQYFRLGFTATGTVIDQLIHQAPTQVLGSQTRPVFLEHYYYFSMCDVEAGRIWC